MTIRIDRPNHEKDLNYAVLTFFRKGHRLVQEEKDFEAGYGWLTVSENGAFAVTWNINASAAYTQVFIVGSSGDIVQNTSTISMVEQTFEQDAKRFCKEPGVNTTAIKWMDKSHLLIAIDAWSSGYCSSNFTEGFLIDIRENRISTKLSEQELLNLPAVCTWNIVPLKEH